jgi:lysyl-tRNA synthetase class 1
LALAALDEELAATSDDASAEDLQNIVYEIGKDPHYGFEGLRDWFKCALRNAAGLEPGPAHGQLHRALRDRQYPQTDRRSAWLWP